MAGKKVLVSNMVIVAVLVSLFVVPPSVGEPSHDVPVGSTNTRQNGEKQLRDTDLECCDDCRCHWRTGYCSCTDWTQRYCTNGCYSCQCDYTNYPYFCRCNDQLDSCPRTCAMMIRQKEKASEAQNTD